MHQREATSIVLDLAPELAKGDPATVLSKYSRARNLAPAQLQRLGNVFNTMSVLVQQERGKSASPYLIDVPNMVGDYLENYKALKRASIFDEPEEPTPVPQEKAAAEFAVFSWLEAPEKQAAELPKQSDFRDYRREMELGVHVAREALTSLQELWPRHIGAFNKLAAHLALGDDPALSFNTLLRDYQELTNRGDILNDGGFSDKLARAFSDKGVDVKHLEIQKSVLARDHTGGMQDALKAAALLDEVETLWEVITQGTSLAVAHKDKFATDMHARRGIEQLLRELRLVAESTGGFKTAAAPQRQEEEQQSPRRAPSSQSFYGSMADGLAEQTQPDGSFWRAGAYGTGAAAALPLEVGRGLARGVGDLPGIWNEFTTEGQTGRSLDALFGEDNRRRAEGDAMDLNRVRQDAESMAVFQKVILSDEVLSRKDPQKVYEAWQTIRKASPEVASDTSILRLMLRTAMETQGVDIDSASAARKFEHGSYKNELSGSNRNQPAGKGN